MSGFDLEKDVEFCEIYLLAKNVLQKVFGVFSEFGQVKIHRTSKICLSQNYALPLIATIIWVVLPFFRFYDTWVSSQITNIFSFYG